jgi:hypothetical protein
MDNGTKCRGCGKRFYGMRGHQYCSESCKPLCSVDDCTSIAKCKGMCQVHYDRVRRRGKTTLSVRSPMSSLECIAPGCKRPALTMGECKLHRNRMRKHGSYDLPRQNRKRRTSGKPCTTPGCQNLTRGGGKCQTCYYRIAKWGTANQSDDSYVRQKGFNSCTRTCIECGKEFSGNPAAKYCSDSCRPHNRRGYWISHSGREAIYRRDNWTCQICGGKVDRNASTFIEGPSIDHIIPVSAGGTSDPSNLRLCHRGCNTLRAANSRSDEEVAGLFAAELALIGATRTDDSDASDDEPPEH